MDRDGSNGLWRLMLIDFLEERTFNALTISIAVVGPILAALAVIYARRELLPPKRQLTVSVLPSPPLLSQTGAPLKGLEVRYEGGDPLHDPYFALISATNTGRHAITSNLYDRDRPIVLRLGVPIVTANVRLEGPQEDFAHEFSGDTIRLGPDLIPTRSTVVVQALTEGKPNLEKEIRHYLTDTEVVYKDPWAGSGRRLSLVLVLAPIAILTLISATIVWFGPWFALDDPQGVTISPPYGAAGTRVAIQGEGFRRFTVARIIIQSKEVGTAQADRNGNFEVAITVPQLPLGENDLTVYPDQGQAAERISFYVIGANTPTTVTRP